MSTTNKVSDISTTDVCLKVMYAEECTTSVNLKDSAENLFEIRRLTGFSWVKLAGLLNVNKRTLFNWVAGAKIRDCNRDHIAKTLEALRFADRGAAELNSAVLNERRHKRSPFEAIQLGKYELAKQLLSDGTSQPETWQIPTTKISPSVEFGQIIMHVDADGTESIQPLPYEPEPASRKRRIKRR